MATSNMHNLATLVKRLEAATSRLEDIATFVDLPNAAGGAASSSSSAAGTRGGARDVLLPEAIEEFDVFLSQSVENYAKLSNEIGGLIAEQAVQVVNGLHEQRKFLLVASRAKKPDLTGSEMSVYQDLVKPINQALMAVNHIKDSSRGSPVFSQLSAVAEGIMMLAWVTVEARPYKHVEESLSSAQFFGNRVLREQKEKDPRQVEWVQAFYQIFRDLVEYVKQYHPNGVLWNPKGPPALDVVKELAATATTAPASTGGAAAGAAAGAAPPPPPPPPPPPGALVLKAAPAASGPPGGLNAVFSDLNKGSAVTARLKKVDKSQMTHKNPALRAGSTVPSGSIKSSAASGTSKTAAADSGRAKGPPKKGLDGNKWTIENWADEPEPIEIQVSRMQSVLISRCDRTTILLRGKANAVTIENSNRLSLLVESLVSSVDAVQCDNLALQVTGALPTILLDQVDGAQIYLSKENCATRVFTSKSDSVNLNVGSGEQEGESVEMPLPSQICSYYDGATKQVKSEIVTHAG